MYTLKPISPRVQKFREMYRTTVPRVDISRYKIITEFYMANPQLTGILKRAKALRKIFEEIPVFINDDEVIVGWPGEGYRSSALYPENDFGWLKDELLHENLETRETDPYTIREEDKQYIIDTADFWIQNGMDAIFAEYMPVGYTEKLLGNGVCLFSDKGNCPSPVGHFTANFWAACDRGFGDIQREAREKMAKLEEEGIFGDSIYKYNFYRAIDIVCGGIIIWSKRYGAKCEELAAKEKDPARKKELLEMADTLNWIMEHPCRNFHDAVQCVYMYQQAICMDGQQHGTSLGRVDQYLGKYYEKDLAEGKITPEYAQELMDLFYMKLAEMNKIASHLSTNANPGYTSGQLCTLGGVNPDGSDATNAVTYMMLQASGRLLLHDPPQALRIHKNTPDELWEAAIETSKLAGGIPSFESDTVIIPALMKRGLPLEVARNYCLEGCVEPAIGGYEWAQPGGNGSMSYLNLVGAFWMAINNGTNPMRFPGGPEPRQIGPQTGYLYDMKSMDEVLEAVKTQFIFWTQWHCSCTNAWESMSAFHLPLPLVSATMDGCMDNGKDVQAGGARYNSTGNSCIGLGNVADSLNVIDYVCFKEKKATTRELYDALINNWEGYDELRNYINGSVPRIGNADEDADKYINFVASTYAYGISRCTGPRGNHFAPGCYPVTANVGFGYMTWASPDGRKTGEPLTDGISGCQGKDTHGPLATLNSVLHFDQSEYSNGTLLNMKFHPTAVSGPEGIKKLRAVMETYFDRGGMELQLNIVSGDTLRKAQKDPDKYRDLVVRVAGFSAYFVEVFKDSQDDLIRRTEQGL